MSLMSILSFGRKKPSVSQQFESLRNKVASLELRMSKSEKAEAQSSDLNELERRALAGISGTYSPVISTLLGMAIGDEERSDRNKFLYGAGRDAMTTLYGRTLVDLHKAFREDGYASRLITGRATKPDSKRRYWLDAKMSEAYVYVYCSMKNPGDKQGHIARFINDSEGRALAEGYVNFLNGGK